MKHKLRDFASKDAQGVKDLILEILAKEYPFDKGAYSDSDLDKIVEIYGGRRNAFFVIDDSGIIVGSAGVKEDSKDEALLRRLFVHPKHRKLGYGTELLKKAVEFCENHGYKKIYFRCTDRMADAMKICLKNGFNESENLEVGGFHIHKLERKLC